LQNKNHNHLSKNGGAIHLCHFLFANKYKAWEKNLHRLYINPCIVAIITIKEREYCRKCIFNMRISAMVYTQLQVIVYPIAATRIL